MSLNWLYQFLFLSLKEKYLFFHTLNNFGYYWSLLKYHLVILIHNYLIGIMIGHFFMYVYTINIFFSINCLFVSFINFQNFGCLFLIDILQFLNTMATNLLFATYAAKVILSFHSDHGTFSCIIAIHLYLLYISIFSLIF